MNKNNLRRICITAYVLLCGLCLGAGAGYSAETTVKKINIEKKNVVINGTASDGFEKGKKVCFYNPETLKRVACGKVKKTGKLTAQVHLSEKAIKKVKMEHTVSTNTEKILSASGEGQESEGSTVFNRVSKMFTLSLFYDYAPMSSVGLKALIFEANDSKKMGKLDSLWSDDSKSYLTSVPASIGGSFSYNINELFSVILGGSYSFVSMDTVQSELDSSKSESYVYTEQKPTLFSVFLDFIAYRKYFGVTGNNLNVLVGVLYENFSSEFYAAIGEAPVGSRSKSSEEKIATVKTSMSVVGARLGGGFNMAVTQTIGLYTSLIAVIPFVGTPSYSTEITPEFIKDHTGFLKDEDIESDLENAMGAEKKFGIDISVGINVSF